MFYACWFCSVAGRLEKELSGLSDLVPRLRVAMKRDASLQNKVEETEKGEQTLASFLATLREFLARAECISIDCLVPQDLIDEAEAVKETGASHLAGAQRLAKRMKALLAA